MPFDEKKAFFFLNQETVEMLCSPSQHSESSTLFYNSTCKQIKQLSCGKYVCSTLRTLVWHYGDSPDTSKGTTDSPYSSAGKPGWEFTISLWPQLLHRNQYLTKRQERLFVSLHVLLLLFSLSISLKSSGCPIFQKEMFYADLWYFNYVIRNGNTCKF